MAGSSLSLVIVIVFCVSRPALFLDNRILDCYKVCHQHSDHCSQRLRTCRECRDFTHGLYCHLCITGYYGNATESKNGCKKCPCSLLKSNGSCTHDEISNTIKCHECKTGYTGDRCENCTLGYYRDLKDGLCLPCYCGGYGNSSFKQQCDPVGGRCYICSHRRAGKHCEHCLDGHYMKEYNGTKSCVRCNCNGNEHPGTNPICDMKSGICLQCVRNATGIQCEKCANGYEGDAINAKNCSVIHRPSPGLYNKENKPTEYFIVGLTTALSVIILLLVAVSMFVWVRRRKARDPLGFVTVSMNNTDEDDYNISWIDPVTGDPICLNGADVQLPFTNGVLVEHSHEDYDDEDDLGDTNDRESRDTDRML